MTRIDCAITCHSLSHHLSQLYTGLTLLDRSGTIRLSQQCAKIDFLDETKASHLRYAKKSKLFAVLNNRVKICYDMHDSYEIDEEIAGACDFYFKRSYFEPGIPPHLQDKVFPYGLNYELYADAIDFYELKRIGTLGSAAQVAKTLARMVSHTLGIPWAMPGFRPTAGTMWAPPDPASPPRVLFMIRAWDPHEDPAATREKIEERLLINETRACCVEMLKKEFGAHFTGGFQHTAYAREHFPGLLLDDPNAASKKNYVALLKRHPICVATAGLHGSIGGKLAEYVAFAKAVISEKITYSVPGPFGPGSNYLEFRTPEECVAMTGKIFSDQALRSELMSHNAAYYQTHLRPDRLVLRTLRQALDKSGTPLPTSP